MRQENSNVGWASRIIALRRRMGVSQSELGKQLNSSAMAVSRWERGVQEPPANIYIQLGNITGDPDCWYFWGRAGLHSGDLMRVLPALRTRLQKERLPDLQIVRAGAHRLPKKRGHLVALQFSQWSRPLTAEREIQKLLWIKCGPKRCWPLPVPGVPI